MEKQVALNPDTSIKGGIYARYSPGRDRDHPPTPKLYDSPTFQDTLCHTLADPEMQKAAVGGLIDEIVVQPTAALEILCSFQTIALRGIEPRFDG